MLYTDKRVFFISVWKIMEEIKRNFQGSEKNSFSDYFEQIFKQSLAEIYERISQIFSGLRKELYERH